MRDHHRVLDLGCGSLRLGRLLIPWLLPDRYYGVEPNEWLVQAGFEKELGTAIRDLKQPRFRYVSDFSLEEFGVDFDYVMAYSVFTHCYEDLLRVALKRTGRVLGPSGLLVGTFVDAPGKDALSPSGGTGWLYPKCVRYTWRQFADLLGESGLVGVRVSRPTQHKQDWFMAARREAEARMRNAAGNVARDEPRPLRTWAARRLMRLKANWTT